MSSRTAAGEGPLIRLFPWRREAARDRAVRDLYTAIVSQARRPDFFGPIGVPDTLDGRFELLALHMHLVLRRLRREAGAPDAEATAQALFDLMFADIDQNLREMGVGDLSVGRKVKEMAEGFYGRIGAYDAGLAAADATVLEGAIRRNVYATASDVDPLAVSAVAAYVRREDGALAACPVDDLLAGRLSFGAPEVR